MIFKLSFWGLRIKDILTDLKKRLPPVTLFFGINAIVGEVCKEIERFY